MEDLQQWVSAPNVILRHLPIQERETFCLSEERVEVTIWCDDASGGQPVVRHQYGEYVGPKLRHMRSRNGEKCILVINSRLAHIGRLYTCGKDPTEIDVVNTRGEWRVPHRLEDRAMYKKLRAEGSIPAAAKGRSPIQLLAEYLAKNARGDKNTALKLANFMSGRNPQPEPETDSTSDASEPPSQGNHTKLKCSGNW